MADTSCFICSLPFSGEKARFVKGKPVCPQCQEVVGAAGTTATPGAPVPAPAPQAVPRPVMPINGGPLYFEHSGEATTGGLLLMPVAGIVTAFTLGHVYALLCDWNPFIYINFLGAIGSGLAIGLAVGMTAKALDSRSPGAAAGMGFISGLAFLWWSWAVWLQSSGYVPEISLSPGAIFQGIQTALAKEVWIIKGITFSRSSIAVCWALEALILLGMPCLTSLGKVSSAPYCERCKMWLPEPVSVEKLSPAADEAEFRARVEKGDFSVVASLVPKGSVVGSYTRLEVSGCGVCRNLNTFTAVLCTASTNKEGEEELDEDYMVDQLLVNKAVVDWVKTLPARP